MRCRETATSVSSGGIAARAREASVCALDVERRRESRAVPSGDEAAAFRHARPRSRALFQADAAPDKDEVVGCDVGHHQQSHPACAVFGGERFSGCSDAPALRPPATSIFPRDVKAGAALDVRIELTGDRSRARVAI